jgi:ABC-2 type transport system permease protein
VTAPPGAAGDRRGGAEPDRPSAGTWLVVAEQELRDLWLGGRGPMLLFAFSLLLSAVTYLSATNQVLNFLEQKEAVNLAVAVAVAVGALGTLVVCADGISGERERETLEALLVTPAPRQALVTGKLVAALSLWLATCAAAVPYVWVLGRGTAVVGTALTLGLLVGTLLAVALGALGLLVSTLAGSNRASLAISLFGLLALFVPTQLPTGLQGGFAETLRRADPIAAGLHYLTTVVVNGHGWTQDLSYLASPSLLAALAGGVLLAAGGRLLRLEGAGR